MVWLSARVAGRRARSAETLLAARALEADARPWGRALSVVSLIVALGSAAGWLEAQTFNENRMTEAFWLSSFILVDVGLLVTLAVAASALVVHQAEYLLEHGPVLATLQAAGTPETALRRVMSRQALIAATPLCVIAALTGLLTLMRPALTRAGSCGRRPAPSSWPGWVSSRAVLAAFFSRRRLRRAVAPARLRSE